MGLDLFDLTKKVAVVTGGSKGFGKAIALGLAEAGADVVVASRTQKDLDLVADEIKKIGRNGLGVATDVTDLRSIRFLADRTMKDFGRIDILVNNAGHGTYIPFLQVTEEQWDSVISVNLKGYFLCAQVLGSYMYKAKSGRIINISSVMGSAPTEYMAHYAASKGGIDAMTKALAIEWAKRGITVNAIAPSFFATDINKVAMEDQTISRVIMDRTPVRRWGQVEELVGLVVYLASDSSRYMTGAIIPLDGGWTAG